MSKITIIMLLCVLFYFLNTEIAFGETHVMIQHADYIGNTIIKNSTSGNETRMDTGPYLLVGKSNDLEYISDFTIRVDQIPESNVFETVNIDSIKLRIFMHDADNFTDKYYVTTYVCVDDFLGYLEKKIKQFDYIGSYGYGNSQSTINCEITSAQDSNIIDSDELPKSYEWDVTNFVSNLIKYGHAKTIKFVINAFPANTQLAYGGIPPEAEGRIGFISPLPTVEIGTNTVPQIIVTYTTTPSTITQFFDFFKSNIIPIVSFAAPVLSYLGKRWYDKIKSTKTTCEILLTDIRRIKNAFENKNEKFNVIDYIIKGGDDDQFRVKYTELVSETDAYEVAKETVGFTNLDLGTRKDLAMFYNELKRHYELQKKIHEIRDQINIKYGKLDSAEFLRIVQPYDIGITKVESTLEKLSKEIEIELKNYMDKNILHNFQN